MPDADAGRLLGVDIGGTKIAVATVDTTTGHVLARRVVSTPAQEGPAAVLDATADLAERVLAAYPAAAVGVGAPGVVDAARGVIVFSSGYLRGWEGTAVAGELSRRLGLPVAVDNDVNAAALGEARHGAGRGLDSFLFVGLGTGLGGAIVQGGRLRRGSTGTAGELGHVPVMGRDEVTCSCGRRGHLEAVVAAPAISAAYARATGEAGVDVRAIARRAESGQAAAAAVLADAGTVLGRTLAGVVNTLDPQAVVLGGGVMLVGRPLWAPLEVALRAETLRPAAGVPLLPAALGVDAGVIGAAALAATVAGPALPAPAGAAAPASS